MVSIISFSTSYFSGVWCIVFAVLFYLHLKKTKDEKRRNYPPSPAFNLPIVGHLLSLVRYADQPWEGFDSIRKKFGDIVYLRLGDYNFLLVSSVKNIKEVLITKQDHFLNRPHFERYKSVFGGDQENALALCDWSELQKQRRSMAQASIIPRYGSKLYENLDRCINEEMIVLNEKLNDQRDVIKMTKLDILVSTFNIFSNYLCSQRFNYENQQMREQIRNYDAIFWDINQCYPFDFMPWLCKLRPVKKQLEDLRLMCNAVRDFIEFELVVPRHNEMKNRSFGKPEALENCKDFLEFNLMTHYANPKDYDWESSLYQMGDLIGGNSAVGNLLYRLLGHLALNQQCQDRIHEEAVHALEHLNAINNEDEQTIRLKHRSLMVYTEASIMEALRIGSSPIVPHVAIQNTTLAGYDVDKNTYIMFNTYNLNMSEDYHFEPKTFEPTRFLVPKDHGSTEEIAAKNPFIRSYRQIEFLKYQVQKPEYYFPFSWGKRACLGYKMVQTITFSTVANLMLNYSIRPVQGGYTSLEKHLEPKGCIALKVDDCYDLIFIPRSTARI